MKWHDKYSVGIEEIDVQHRELLRMFSLVQDAAQGRQGWSEIHYGIVEVISFADFHFRFEEALMRMYGFPDYAEHSQLHRHIIKRAHGVVQETLRSESPVEVIAFFRDWLVSHMQGEDRAYAHYILTGPNVKAFVRPVESVMSLGGDERLTSQAVRPRPVVCDLAVGASRSAAI